MCMVTITLEALVLWTGDWESKKKSKLFSKFYPVSIIMILFAHFWISIVCLFPVYRHSVLLVLTVHWNRTYNFFHLLKIVISFLKMNIGIRYTIVSVISCWPLFIKVWIWNILLMWFWNIVLMWFWNIVLKCFSFLICIVHC